MSRIRIVSARSMRLAGQQARVRLSRVRRTLRHAPLSLTERVLLILWACMLTSLVWASLLVGLVRAMRIAP
ncbi:hypothetical protein LGN19_13385 [Burkholderia sp. AU30198]|uniref:hypothetical protein n=1 Tax=Burkholderia sp. AU30198 TaxID=2879627 RepID=UPI001CF1DCCF|nr:hypothetical protein [Burkholderia sp. AU30198]MCA8294787.1 hypothetical protein [Burkholderia sp. AU30198]